MGIYELVFLFMIYGFIGWCWETPYVSFQLKRFVNRGFLNGPFIPIYSIGAIFMIKSETYIKPYLSSDPFLKALLLIFYAAIMSSILEYITSFLMEKAFNTRWWDYSERKLNLNGRICLFYSLGWGIVGYSIISWIQPLVNRIILAIPREIGYIIISIYCVLFVIDVCLTLKDLISLGNIMADLLQLTNDFKVKIVDGIVVQKEKLSETLEEKHVKIKEEFINIKVHSGAKLSQKQDNLNHRINNLLEKSRRYSRFYQSFPRAYSHKFKDLIDIVRKKKTM